MRIPFVSSALLMLCLGIQALAAEEGPILFSDDFSTQDPGWGEVDDEYLGIENHKLLMQAQKGIERSQLYQGDVFEDVDVSVKVTETSGDVDVAAGIIFWAKDYTSYYVVKLCADGDVAVERKLSKGRYLKPVEWKTYNAVKKGLNQVNELRVVTKGAIATVYVNGEQVAALKGSPPAGGSLVGLMASSAEGQFSRFEFSEFVVRKSP